MFWIVWSVGGNFIFKRGYTSYESAIAALDMVTLLTQKERTPTDMAPMILQEMQIH